MEKHAFPKANLSDVRVIMAILCAAVEELLCQAAMGCILVLKYLLSAVHGRLGSCPIVPGIKCCRAPGCVLSWEGRGRLD
jgi:hypothetical protein